MLLGRLGDSVGPPFPPLIPLDPSKLMWVEQFATKAAYDAHKGGSHLAGFMPLLMPHAATGSPADFDALECEMLHLGRPHDPQAAAGYATGVGCARIVGLQVKEESDMPEVIATVRMEIEENMNEPGFICGTILLPTPAQPTQMRWLMHWASAEAKAEHAWYPHHRQSRIFTLFPKLDMSGFGGALEWPAACCIAK